MSTSISNNRNARRYSPDKKSSMPGKPRRRRKLKKSIVRFFTTIAVFISVILISGICIMNHFTKDVADLNKAMLEGRYSHNEIAKIEEVPMHLKNAVIAIEDNRFYSHKGIDLIGLTRAFIKNTITGTKEGGSTIEMQISKNLMTSKEKTFERKLKDIKIAHEMNKVMSKDEILQVYLNSIYLGKGATGVKAGARIYFGKDIGEINLAESAMLAGITKNPSKYSVYKTETISKKDTKKDLENLLVFSKVSNDKKTNTKEIADKLKKFSLINEGQYKKIIEGSLYVEKAVLNQDAVNRQRLVLDKMKRHRYISKKEYEEALNYKIVLNTSLK